MTFLVRTRLIRLLGFIIRMGAACIAPFLFLLRVVWAVVSRRGQRVLRVVEGRRRENGGGSNRVCLYSHFDRDDLLAPHVLHAVSTLARLGYRVHFITTSRRLSQAVVDALTPHCERIIHKDNYGLDFGSWKLGWRMLREEGRPDELLLLNDSVYGPLTDLGSIIERMNREACDFWGITDSWERKYHLQSYFVFLRKQVLESPAFDRFWDSFWVINDKRYIVQRGEIGLTQWLLKAGFVPKVLCAYLDVRTHVVQRLLADSAGTDQDASFLNLPSGRTVLTNVASAEVKSLLTSRGALLEATLNPMHYFWKELLLDFGCPFIKVDLLARNPVGIANAYQWKAVLAEHTSYEPALIESHLYRLTRKRVP